MVEALDECGLGLPLAGHHARQLVGLLRAGMGWLVVLGSGRKCVVHALANGNRLGAQPSSDRKKGRVSILDRATRDFCFFIVVAGDVSRALRRADECSRFRC